MTTIKEAARKTLRIKDSEWVYYDLTELEKRGFGSLSRLPYSIRILLESALRNCDGFVITEDILEKITHWHTEVSKGHEIAFKPGRVVLQDFTGVPAVVDLAAMRSALKRLGGDYRKINPLVPCDLVVDHSVQVDAFGSADALRRNIEIEFSRNRERYEFLKWGQSAFRNFRVVPPATGIVHQVNLEYLAQGVLVAADKKTIYPDTLVGTDSHTTMINGIGVLGWGVGGIEAEAVMLGEPIFMRMPEVIGFCLKGRLKEGVTATDLVLTVTQMLRAKGVVGKFVEYYGPGLAAMPLPDRATLANMAPEYGATAGFFPVDQETLRYYQTTGRSSETINLVEQYMRAQGLFYDSGAPAVEFSDTLELDLAMVEPCLAGPKRPQDRLTLKEMKTRFYQALQAPVAKRGFGLGSDKVSAQASIKNGQEYKIGHGVTVIAAITSCTNTSNPAVMIAAGLVAKKAVARGLRTQPYVKTSLAPGSTVVTEYLRAAKLDAPLDELGFQTVGYGCTTCIGNSGPLPDAVTNAIQSENLVAASVLSGNRNFEGRVNPHVKANYLASPPLVVAYALAGRVDIDFETEALGVDPEGRKIYLKDIWPSHTEVVDAMNASISKEIFLSRYADVFKGNEAWNAIQATASDLYSWDETSTYIQEPPFFETMQLEVEPIREIRDARVLVMLGDSVTTDHISPAGAFSAESPAGKYLIASGVRPKDFNSYGSRRGNDRVMLRGTFANVRLRNQLSPGKEGSATIYFPENKETSIYGAAMQYKEAKIPLIVLAGKEYGSGSSRDWAAKGTYLLGVRAVIAESYERIHRSNLVGMGVLPLQYEDGESAASLFLDGTEIYTFSGIDDHLKPGQKIKVQAKHLTKKSTTEFSVLVRIDTPIEVDYYRHGGILQRVIRKLAK